uniref:Uncharacterized protein n=1 Tax=Schmidtea mediterranea TaxID=79327 RepID=I1ZIB6_SCHMD|nr:hypothetical protein [Schmidtea mediterranea]
MNKIRHDELEKIKRRRKQKSKGIIAATVTSKAQKAFMKHIDASRYEIEKSRFRYYFKDGNKSRSKLTLGIFDNAVGSRNINHIFNPVLKKENFVDLQAACLYQPPIMQQNLVIDAKHEISLEASLVDLADSCCKMLNIHKTDGDLPGTGDARLRLREAKADAKRDDKLKLIDVNVKNGVSFVGKKSETGLKSFKFNNRKETLFDKTNYPVLSASTSISNSLILFRPLITNIPIKRKSIELDNHYKTSHPIWDTPEDLRTSHLRSFSDRSIIDKSITNLGTSKFGTSLWLDD